MEETLKRIDKTQQTLAETKNTIGQIDNLYTRLEKTMSDSIDNAVALFQKNQAITVA